MNVHYALIQFRCIFHNLKVENKTRLNGFNECRIDRNRFQKISFYIILFLEGISPFKAWSLWLIFLFLLKLKRKFSLLLC